MLKYFNFIKEMCEISKIKDHKRNKKTKRKENSKDEYFQLLVPLTSLVKMPDMTFYLTA